MNTNPRFRNPFYKPTVSPVHQRRTHSAQTERRFPDFSDMTPEQISLAVALAARLNDDRPQNVQVLGRATCPHCDHNGPIETDFGVRVVRGTMYAQSWCRQCRAERRANRGVHPITGARRQ